MNHYSNYKTYKNLIVNLHTKNQSCRRNVLVHQDQVDPIHSVRMVLSVVPRASLRSRALSDLWRPSPSLPKQGALSLSPTTLEFVLQNIHVQHAITKVSTGSLGIRTYISRGFMEVYRENCFG